jgi:signal transduction histidine kinase
MVAPSVLLEMLFDRMPMGIAVIDRAYRIQRFNPTWQDYSDRYAPAGGARLQPGVGYFEHLPGAEATVLPLFARVLAGEVVRQEDVRLDLAGIVTYWDVTLAPLLEDGEVVGILNVTVDATERVLAQRYLEQRVEERTRELDQRREIAESLRDILGMINAKVPLEMFLARAVKLAAQRMAAAACVLHRFDVENQRIIQLASYGVPAALQPGDARPFSAMQISGGADYLTAALRGEPTYGNYPPYPQRVAEIKDDPTIPEDVKRRRVALREAFAGSLAVPLFARDQVYGGLVFYYAEAQQFGEEQVQLAMTFAEQMAVAIENARLFEETERRRAVAESLADILSILNSTRSSQEIFDYVTQRSCELLQADACLLYSIQDNALVHEANYNLPEDLAAMKTGDLYRSQQNLTLLNRQPVAISDAVTHLQGLLAQTDLSSYQRRWYQGLLASFQAYLGIPLIVNDQVFGGLVFYFRTSRAFSDDDIQLGQTLAGHAALAIENARLRHQAAEMATLAERSRLARDLHDAVTQTLFSASLIADVLPVLWERNPDMGRQKLDELRLLTRGAQSEMRTLLLELRPDTLADVELGDLYRHLANAFSGRTRVPVTFTQEGQAPLPPPVKEVCYRVAQEALNNIAKHANASAVQLRLNAQPDWVEVGIYDNGDGFDAAGLAPENLGLKIMRERAETIGAQLSIDSQPGLGTQVELVWRANHEFSMPGAGATAHENVAGSVGDRPERLFPGQDTTD